MGINANVGEYDDANINQYYDWSWSKRNNERRCELAGGRFSWNGLAENVIFTVFV